MRTRDEVLREFLPESEWDDYDPQFVMELMADRIRELEAQQAASEPVAVTEEMEEAFMSAYAECEFQNGGVFTHRMGINAGIAAALTAASEGVSDA